MATIIFLKIVPVLPFVTSWNQLEQLIAELPSLQSVATSTIATMYTQRLYAFKYICSLCKGNYPWISCSSRRPPYDYHCLFYYVVCSWVQLHHCKAIAQLRTDTVTTTALSSSCHLMIASYRATQSTYPPISYNSTTASFKAGERFHYCTPTTSLATVYHSTQICFTTPYTNKHTSLAPKAKFPPRSSICHTTCTQFWIWLCDWLLRTKVPTLLLQPFIYGKSILYRVGY